MAHFIGNIQGMRKGVSRLGGKNTGIHGHLRGWNVGVKVELHYDSEKKKDVCRVYKTGGSNNTSGALIAEFTE